MLTATVVATRRFFCLSFFLFVCICVCVGSAETDLVYPTLPLQFSADLETIAHLVDRNQDYPPWFRRISIAYDFTNGLARAEIMEGYEAGRTYIRRYQDKKEYMVKGGEYPECRRSYLGEEMPLPELPQNAEHQGTVILDGRSYVHWMDRSMEEYSLVHIYQDPLTKLAVRVMEESIIKGEAVPTMTYELKNLVAVPPAKSNFDLPDKYSHKSCTRHLTGFPYLHAFHYYLRF